MLISYFWQVCAFVSVELPRFNKTMSQISQQLGWQKDPLLILE